MKNVLKVICYLNSGALNVTKVYPVSQFQFKHFHLKVIRFLHRATYFLKLKSLSGLPNIVYILPHCDIISNRALQESVANYITGLLEFDKLD